MPLAVAPEVAYVSPASNQMAWGQSRGKLGAYAFISSDIHRSTFEELTFGRENYPLWRPVAGRLLPDPQANRYVFQLNGLSNVSGAGDTPQEAIDAFLEQFHIRFQELVFKRPFEMDGSEKNAWDEIRRLVDVELYRSRIPVLVRQFGEIVSTRPGHRMVCWEGIGNEPVDLAKYPGEFASFRVGQPFEAYVERDQQKMQVVSVFQVKRTKRPTHRTTAENDAIAVSLGSSKDLPVASLK